MQTYETLKHTTWDCKYHVVFITKCRKKTLYGQIRRELGPVFRELAQQKECALIEGHLMPDHVHNRNWGAVLDWACVEKYVPFLSNSRLTAIRALSKHSALRGRLGGRLSLKFGFL